MTYQTTKLSHIDGDSIRALTTIPDIITEHGMKVPAGVTEATQRHAEIIGHIATIVESVDSGSAYDAAARSLADGSGTVEQLTTAVASRLIAVKDPQSPYRAILKRARHFAAQDLQRAYAEHGDKWITNVLRPAIHDAVSILTIETEYAPRYDAFMDPRAADNWTANRKVAEAWATIRTAYSVARTLRKYRVTPGTERRDDVYEWAGDGEYNTVKGGDHLTYGIRDNFRDDSLTWFLMALQNGMTPTLLTDKEVSAHG